MAINEEAKKTAKQIYDCLRENKINCGMAETVGDAQVPLVHLLLSGKRFQRLQVIIYVNGKEVCLLCRNVRAFPESRRGAMLRTMNDLNRTCRFFRCYPQGGSVCVSYSFQPEMDNAGEWAHHMVLRLALWLEQAVPALSCAAEGN